MRISRIIRGTLIAAALIAPCSTIAAQGQVGVIAGATFSTLRGVDGLDSRTGLIGGLTLVFPSAGPLSLQTGALFVAKGATAGSSTTEGIEINYLEIPGLIRLDLSRGSGLTPHIYAGPYFGLQLSCTLEETDADCDRVGGVNSKTVDIGGIVGGGLDLNLGPLILTGGLRYGFGVSKIADFEFGSVNESAKNGTFAIYTGLAFKLGG
ncbi:MAG: porin family protein [Gemmatimonadota bacterium]